MMDREMALETLRALNTGDTEADHQDADDLLCRLLVSLGYQDVVDAWNAVPKWYA